MNFISPFCYLLNFFVCWYMHVLNSILPRKRYYFLLIYTLFAF